MKDLVDRNELLSAIYNDNPDDVMLYIARFPSEDPEPSRVAEDIATILKKLQDMRTILQNAEEPKRKKGKWEICTISMADGEDYKCSECGQFGCMPSWNYCPNCGTDMRGEVNGGLNQQAGGD